MTYRFIPESIIFRTVLNISMLCILLLFFMWALPAQAEIADIDQAGNAEIANELTNPLADLMIFPVQLNYDNDIGPQEDGWKFQMNIMPVIPFHLNEEWNLITRTIMPSIYQEDIFSGSGSDLGLGDITQSFLFSPKKPTAGGLIWGAGPVQRYPTATESLLGAKKWGAGPTILALTKQGPFTFGAFANHLWSFAGDSDRQDISTTLLQPFAAYTWPSAWVVSVQSESIYNWKTENWAAPINVSLAKVVRWGRLPVSAGYWMESPDEGPEGFRFFSRRILCFPNKRVCLY